MQLAFSDGSHYVDPRSMEMARARLHGMGALDPQSQQIAGIAATGATTAAGILIALSVAVPIVGPIVAAITSIGIAIANAFGGCGNTCVAATHIADQVGELLVQMLDAYMSAPVHYKSMQTAYLVQWDAAWNALVHACSDPNLQAAGQRCISDRQRGSCKWHTSPGGWQQQGGTWVYVAPGQDGSGTACWDWFVGSRDPVANDPTVVPDPVGATVNADGSVTPNPLSSIFGAGGASLGPVLLIGGGIAAALLLLGSD